MDYIICNKCSITSRKGKKPFYLLQCGHMYCQGCVQQAQKQCSQCEYVEAASIPLHEPIQSKIAYLFTPPSEILENLQKSENFRATQMRITMQRFYELEQKYQILKSQFWNANEYIKVLNEKYHKEKAEREKYQKRLMFLQARNSSFSVSSPSTVSTPLTSDYINVFSRNATSKSSRCSSNSNASPFIPSNMTPMQHFKITREHVTSDGFRIPDTRRAPRSAGSRVTSDTDSSSTYRG